MSIAEERIQTGSDLIAEFIAQKCFPKVFLVTGGAAAFMIDALDRNEETDYVCVQHEQAASMATDAIWRTKREIGVSMATSGPGATNLITGIASSWFDSIPALHITGQVNDRESKVSIGANVRQAGFQETDIVSMVSTVTKSAIKVKSVSELASALRESLNIALSGRMGPVLIDVPMNVQQERATPADFKNALEVDLEITETEIPESGFDQIALTFSRFLQNAERPLFVFGGGAGLAGVSLEVQDWCESKNIPYVASWAGMTFLNRSLPGYQGTQGVYGLRHSNWCVQSADKIVVLGSRLDNRQRTGNPKAYAPFAEVLVVDVDEQEISKFNNNKYTGINLNLEILPSVLDQVDVEGNLTSWNSYIENAKKLQPNDFDSGVTENELDPYQAVAELQKHFAPGTTVIADTGATLCWTFQAFGADTSHLFTAGGNSPMGYSLPAAIGAQIANHNANVVCIIGDGGFQMNIQELQTAAFYETPICIVIFNNSGYGIIKQFQDSNTKGNYAATGRGYSVPNIELIAKAYGIEYHKIDNIRQIKEAMQNRVLKIVELNIPQNALVTPKAEGDHFIHDQFPYDRSNVAELPYDYPAKPSLLN